MLQTNMDGIVVMVVCLWINTVTGHASDQCKKLENCSVCENGKCRECKYGWFGDNCKSECQNCWTSGCHKESGTCAQCKPGRYREDCGTSCPDNCRADRKGGVYCRKEDGMCLDGCKDSWWGDTCNRTCSEKCAGKTCQKDNGDCKCDCIYGWWGGNCTRKCSPGCLNEKCSSSSGKCIDGCKGAFLSNNCTVCSMKCKSRSCDINGLCESGCIDGFKGETCSNQIATVPDLQTVTGHASDQCKKLSNCSVCENDKCQECVYGWFGDDCNRECQNCWTSGCDQRSGKCAQCKSGRYREHCETLCPENCRADKRGNVSCRRENGECLDGCKDSWWGDTCIRKCSEHCEEKTCQQNNGDCKCDCIIGWWGGNCTRKCSKGCLNGICCSSSGKCSDGCKRAFIGNNCTICDKTCNGANCDTHCGLDTATFVHFQKEQEITIFYQLLNTFVLVLPPVLVVFCIGVMPKCVQCLCRKNRRRSFNN